MDANGLRFWLLADGRHFPSCSHAVWDRRCRVLRLASERALPPPADIAAALATASSALERVPRTLDAHGSLARWVEQADAHGNVGAVVVASPHLPDEIVLLALPERPSDLVAGHDGVLYLVLGDRVLMHDLRGRWSDETVRLAGFAPWRIAADAAGGAWIIERASGRLARLEGLPLPLRPHADYAATTFRPSPENPRPPALRMLEGVVWPSGERPVALAAHPQQGLVLLSWMGAGQARLRRLDADSETLAAPISLPDARYAYALAWLDDERFAVRLPGRHDAPAFALDDGEADDARAPLGEIYPLADDAVEAPFVHRLDGPPHYPTGSGSEPLHALSIANLARSGAAQNFVDGQTHLLDSGSQVTVWHRLYAEASIPPGAGFIVWLAATAEPAAPTDDAAWCAHRFGRDIPRAAGLQEPQAAWEALPSELPAHPGLGPWPSERDRSGLFSVLIQDPRPRVRTLVGRYLWVRVELFGDGRVGPEIAALRCWGSRFSYRDQYLPRLYRETLYGAPALAPGEAIDRLDLGLVSQLDAGGTPSGTLADGFIQAGLRLGPAMAIRIDQPGKAWLLQDAASGQAWPVRKETHVITLYRETPLGAPGGELGRPVNKLDVQFVPQLDAGGTPSGTLADGFVRAGLRLSPSAAIRVDQPGKAWLLQDAASGRAWPLRSDAAIALYRPAATPADFLDRFLASFEAMLTPLEDRVAAAHLLTDPASAPQQHLDWLAGWIGVAFDPALPAERRRRWLAAAPALARMHGSRRGLELALDIASGGGVAGGEIVVIEGFRLRRLLATLLGVDLGDDTDPLLPGLTVSGNSIVGDSLILGESEKLELLALFREEVATIEENAAVRAFYERLAHRATALVHQSVSPQDLGLLRRVIELEAPAHVDTRIVSATWPLLVGIASLVGVDTYLGPPPRPQPARTDVSSLGLGDYVLGPTSLDPRRSGAAAPPVSSPPPVAQAGPDFTAPFGRSFNLDGSGSSAAPGRRIQGYIWTRVLPAT
jgi:phage tail-like protein